MGLLVALHGWAAVNRGDTASRWILAGVAVSALAAMVQYFGIAPHPHFNHNDLYHVVQITAMALFYGGGKLLRDRNDIDG
jgi:peptidoglycan/LPS O-acetylase OafA/YrhL